MQIVKTADDGTPLLAKIYSAGTAGFERIRALGLTNDMQYLYAGAKQAGKPDEAGPGQQRKRWVIT